MVITWKDLVLQQMKIICLTIPKRWETFGTAFKRGFFCLCFTIAAYDVVERYAVLKCQYFNLRSKYFMMTFVSLIETCLLWKERLEEFHLCQNVISF